MFKTYALAESILPYGGHLHVLLIDGTITIDKPTNIDVYKLSDIHTPIARQIISKYGKNPDKLRWGLKPVFLDHLLAQYDKMVYLDNDIFVFANPSFVFEELEHNAVLLTPHRYPSDPTKNQNWFEANYRVGLYNAGFIAVSKQSSTALNWWATCCLYNMKKAFWRGLFDDQKYLDLLPILFDGVKIQKHSGYNLAGWNDHTNPSQVVFIHFANITLQKFLVPTSAYYSYASQYVQILKQYNPSYQYRKKLSRYEIGAFIYFLLWKMVRQIER